MSELLRPYVPRVVIDWLRETPSVAHRRVEGSLVFADISGFTSLTERLARRGKVGAEEMGDILNDTFEQLLVPAYEYGAALIKWGGDAVLLLLQGDDHAARACRGAHEMQQVIGRIGKLRTPAGAVTLRMSVGVHSGVLDFFLVGTHHRELVVAGSAATETALMEQLANAGEIVVSLATAALLDPAVVGERRDEGLLLSGAPDVTPQPSPPVDLTGLPDLHVALAGPIAEHVSSGVQDSEHRQVTAAFVGYSGVDAMLAERGPDEMTEILRGLVEAAQDAAERCGVTFLGTDVARDGGKVILLAGAPRNLGDAEERMLGAVRAILDTPCPLPLRAGATTGRVFTGDFGPTYRRTYSVVGDSVNLAARLMGHAEPGQLVVTPSVVERARTPFAVQPMEPFLVKGKSEPIEAFAVGHPLADVDRDADAVREESESPFVGRENEVVALLGALHQAKAGHGQMVEIVGEAGMGKSRLVEEGCRQFNDVERYFLACDVYEASTPYAALRRLLTILLGLTPGLDDDAAAASLLKVTVRHCPEILPWLPLVASVVGVPMRDTPEVEALEERFRPHRLARTVTHLLGRLLTTPTVLAIDDVHAMDEASAEVLSAVARAGPGHPWLVIVTRRPVSGGFAAPTDGPVTSLWLTPLSDDSATELLDELTEAAPLSPHEADAVREHAGGNPLYLLELLAARQRVGSIDALPDTLEGVISAQIDALPAPARRLLRAASILGTRADLSLLDSLIDDDTTSDPDLWQLLDPFLVPDSGGGVRFRHALVREAAYESLPYRRRRLLHGRVGEVLEKNLGEHPDEQLAALSFHFFCAQRFDSALEYSRRAGERAQAQYANVEAAEFYRRAIDAAQRLRVSAHERAQLAESLGEVWFHLGEFARADEFYRLARRYVGAGDPLWMGRLRLRMARVAIRAGRYPQALRALSRGLRELEGTQSADADAWTAKLCAQYAFVRHMQGKERDTLRWAQRAVDRASSNDADDALAQAYQLIDWAHITMGRFSYEHYALAALDIWEKRGELHWQAMVLNHLGIRAYFLGEWNKALDMYDRSKQALERVGDQWNAAIALGNVAEIYVDQGRLEDAEALARRAIRVFRAAGTPNYIAGANALLGRIAARNGSFDEAHEFLQSAKDDYLKDGDLPEAIETDARVAECLALDGRAEEALALVDCISEALQSADGVAAIEPLLERVRAYAHAQKGDWALCLAALETSLLTARRRNAQHDVALTLDAMVRVDAAEGMPPDPTVVAERDRLFNRLGIVSALVVPLPSEVLRIPEPRVTALSASIEPA